MASPDMATIIETIRGVVVDGDGVAFTISNRFRSGTYDGQDDSGRVTNAVIKPAANVTVGGLTRDPSSPQLPATTRIWRFDVMITITRHIYALHAADPAELDAAKGAAAADGAVLADALTFGGNVPGVISSCLRYESSTAPTIRLNGEDPSFIETIHNFTGWVQVEA